MRIVLPLAPPFWDSCSGCTGRIVRGRVSICKNKAVIPEVNACLRKTINIFTQKPKSLWDFQNFSEGGFLTVPGAAYGVIFRRLRELGGVGEQAGGPESRRAETRRLWSVKRHSGAVDLDLHCADKLWSTLEYSKYFRGWGCGEGDLFAKGALPHRAFQKYSSLAAMGIVMHAQGRKVFAAAARPWQGQCRAGRTDLAAWPRTWLPHCRSGPTKDAPWLALCLAGA